MTINHIHPYTVFWAYMACGHLPMANRERRCFTNVNIYLKCFEAVRIERQKRRNHNKSSFRFMKNSSPQKIAPTLSCFIGIFELFLTGILAAAWKYFRLISAFCSQPACRARAARLPPTYEPMTRERKNYTTYSAETSPHKFLWFLNVTGMEKSGRVFSSKDSETNILSQWNFHHD